MYKINKVNSWNGWDPLKQVILGNVFEPEFFEDLPNDPTAVLTAEVITTSSFFIKTNLYV